MSKYLAISLVIVALILGIGIGYVITPEYAKLSMQHAGNLGKADDNYDLRFLDAMIEHHEDAVEMAEDAEVKSNRKEILELSREIIVNQTKEIEMMMSWRDEWYKSNTNY